MELYQLHRPDVALLDLRMPGLDGVEALTAIRAGDPAARVILLTTFDDEEDVHRGLRAGARGYLLKDATPQDLAGAIRKVVAGQLAIAAGVAARLAERLQGSALSEREMEVLRLVALGRSNKQIAKALDIAEGTVKVHVASILEKLGAHGRTEAVAFAARRGLIRLA